jgi:hypothetical protein
MDAEQLINELSKLAPKTKIVVRGYEIGYNNIMELKPIILEEMEYRTETFGRYDECYTGIHAIELHGFNVNDLTID